MKTTFTVPALIVLAGIITLAVILWVASAAAVLAGAWVLIRLAVTGAL